MEAIAMLACIVVMLGIVLMCGACMSSQPRPDKAISFLLVLAVAQVIVVIWLLSHR